MKKSVCLLALFLTVFFPLFCSGKGFVICIDSVSYRQAETEVKAYAKAIGQVQGMKVYTLIDKWNVPDSIRKNLYKMYRHGKISGVVFIGDIPIPMICDGQHLTSAFKMDQRQPRQESSVPSDRFYDDFGLKFNYLDHDAGTPLYYYSLRGDSEQQIHCNLFSGRIRPTDAGGVSRYEKLRRYLRKVVEEKRSGNYLDRVLFFRGKGCLSDSRVAVMDEKLAYYEHFPWLKSVPGESISYLDCSRDPYIKIRLMNELQRPDLDLAVLHHHGDYNIQYLNDPCKGAPEKEDSAMRDLHLSDFATYHFKPNCRVIILDACFNCAFQKENCIANAYIFSEGHTVACMGGTVNMIQDKRYDRLIGLLGLGFTIGEINKYQGTLESHIIGDPTFTFKMKKGVRIHHCADWLAYQMIHQDEKGKLSPARLLKDIQTSPYREVRLQALEQLAIYHRGKDLVKGITCACHDQNEMIQRFAVKYIRQCGDSILAVPLMNLLISSHTSLRVLFDAEETIKVFPKDVLVNALSRIYPDYLLVDSDSVRNELFSYIQKYANYWDPQIDKLLNDSLSDGQFRFYASCMRLYCPHSRIPDMMKYVENNHHKENRRQMIMEAMGWYTRSYNTPYIASVALQMSRDHSLGEALRNEALKTYNRVRPLPFN
ncbi:MAG: C25 family cysteine peptidase [Prevotella sp.]|jgi:hypothetical protein|nr:C25 family cysteine peptidase [Prevotella sp.]MCH4240790.1 C25 family cysteine peptidase [Prevotella sp.]MCI1741065.1 C25 family cysteine peptidase [Prevotella sp.]